jgi:hypothetical protein
MTVDHAELIGFKLCFFLLTGGLRQRIQTDTMTKYNCFLLLLTDNLNFSWYDFYQRNCQKVLLIGIGIDCLPGK